MALTRISRNNIESEVQLPHANAAYDAANSSSSYANSAFEAANTAGGEDSWARDTANSAGVYANSSFSTANTKASTGKAIAMSIVFG
jgi:type II secretory pathway pseudopilin PulG